jgi:hypothetical protein
MKYEIDLPPEIQHSLSVRASETGKDVVHLIQLAVVRFVKDEISEDGNSPWTPEGDKLRCELIDKEIAGTITVKERATLAVLQRLAERHFDELASPPIDAAVEFHQRLISKRDA